MTANFEIEFDLTTRTKAHINVSLYELSAKTGITVVRMADIINNACDMTADEDDALMDWLVERSNDWHHRDKVNVRDYGSEYHWKVKP